MWPLEPFASENKHSGSSLTESCAQPKWNTEYSQDAEGLKTWALSWLWMAIICSYAIYLIIVPGFLEVPSLHCFRNRVLGLLLSRMHSPDSAVDFKAESFHDQFSSVAQSCPTLCDSMNCSTPGFPVLYQLLELAQTHVHWVVMPSNHLITLWGCLLMMCESLKNVFIYLAAPNLPWSMWDL